MVKQNEVKIYWCKKCNVPIIKETDSERICPECGGSLRYVSADIRPVFSAERRLLEIIKGTPDVFKDCSVWANRNKYIIDGRKLALSVEEIRAVDADYIREQLKLNNESGEDQRHIERFISANRERLSEIVAEATEYIKEQSVRLKHMVVSFSGGKDSTATSALVMQALGERIRHIFIDTTLELDSTYDYITEYQKHYPDTPFSIAKNEEQDFFKVAEEIGPPAAKLRWCCTMFKTGAVNRVFGELFNSKKVLTFYGVRQCESAARSKYSRTEDKEESTKVAGQIVASPIFYWRDCDIWLYLLAYKIPFNEAYRQGFFRVGCFNCPNTTDRAELLARIYMPEKSKQWRDFLLRFAENTGKGNVQEYVDNGYWKARYGGNGLKAAADVKIKQTNCTTEEHAKIYELNKPISDCFYNLFTPFGRVSKELGRKLIGEILILDRKSSMPILSIQPFKSDFEYSVKVVVLNPDKLTAFERMIGYQIRKYNACKQCLKCEAVCKSGAITVQGGGYNIDEKKCSGCQMCVTNKYLRGGCLMSHYLLTRKDYDYDRV